MSFYSFYPPAGSGSSNASVGVNGTTAPTSSTEVGGINPSGNLQPLQTDASGALITTPAAGSVQHVIVDSSALPTGAATSANQTSQITQETAIAGSVASIDGKTVHVDTGNVTVVASALPTGASTSALQTTGNTTLSTIASNQTNGTQTTQITGTVPLPTGAATAANQVTGNNSLASIDTKTPTVGQKTMANSSPVVIASDQSSIPVTGPLTDTQLRATPVPVSGTVTASNPSVGSNGTAIPTSSTLVGGSDGTNLRPVKVSAAGVISVDASGTTVNTNLSQVNGAVTLVGNGITGTGSQRVTIASDNTAFTVNAAQSGTWNINNVSGTVSLPTGAATEATLAKLPVNQGSTTSGQAGPLIQGAVTTAAPTYTTAQTSPLSLTTSGALRVDSSGSTQPVSGTVTANIGTTNGLALDATVSALQVSQGSTTSGEKGTLILGAVTTAAPTYTTAQSSPLSLDTTGALRVNATVTTSVPIATTATLTNVSASATSVSLLATAATRKQATFFNDSVATLYLKFGTTASTTSYTVQIPGNSYYEMPGLAIYTGAIDGIWSSATGTVRITEMT